MTTDLPDALERVGVVVGSALLLGLPTSALTSLWYGVGEGPGLLAVFLPGLVVGPLVATDRLDATYHQLWKFSLTSYVFALLYGVVGNFGTAGTNRALAVGWWLAAVALGAVVARVRVRDLLSTGPESSA